MNNIADMGWSETSLAKRGQRERDAVRQKTELEEIAQRTLQLLLKVTEAECSASERHNADGGEGPWDATVSQYLNRHTQLPLFAN